MGILGDSIDDTGTGGDMDELDGSDRVEGATRRMMELRALEDSSDVDTARFTMQLPEPLKRRFREACDRQGRDMSAVVREFMHLYTSD
jgi:hypothetical protein